MKKKLLALLVIIAMLTTVVCAYTTQDNNTADALHDLGLFQGMGGSKGYALDENLTRGQGITLLVRMLGKEDAALSGTYTNSFTDVPDWAKGYIGYAFANDITKGVSATAFGTDAAMTDYMFLTLVLRALAYSDAGAAPQFTWDNPYALSKQLGLISYTQEDTNFTRADAIRILWNAMSVQFNGRTDTLSDSLIAQNVFTAEQWAAAQTVKAGGKQDSSAQQSADKNGGTGLPSGSGSGSESGSGSGSTGGDYDASQGGAGGENETEMDTELTPAPGSGSGSGNTGSGSGNTGSGSGNTGSGSGNTGSGSGSGGIGGGNETEMD